MEEITETKPTKASLKKWHYPFLLFLLIGTGVILTQNKQKDVPFQHSEGVIFGTTYHATYQCNSNLTGQIMEQLHAVDRSLSMFNPQSTVSRINAGSSLLVDSLFKNVYHIACSVSQATDGAFDITVAPLVNAWGFGFKKNMLPDSAQVDSLKQFVGWQRLCLKGDTLLREDPRMVIDLSAVAKGYGSDCVAEMFRQHGIENFMVEIGGEVVTSGTNPKGNPWRIGINKPEENGEIPGNELQTILQLNNCAMATSGNYRNFYVQDGRKIAHTIDPKSGYPVQHSILSSTVIAPSCAIADAFATSFMVLGLEKATAVLEKHNELQAYFIYSDSAGLLKVWQTPGLEKLIVP